MFVGGFVGEDLFEECFVFKNLINHAQQRIQRLTRQIILNILILQLQKQLNQMIKTSLLNEQLTPFLIFNTLSFIIFNEFCYLQWVKKHYFFDYLQCIKKLELVLDI